MIVTFVDFQLNRLGFNEEFAVLIVRTVALIVRYIKRKLLIKHIGRFSLINLQNRRVELVIALLRFTINRRKTFNIHQNSFCYIDVVSEIFRLIKERRHFLLKKRPSFPLRILADWVWKSDRDNMLKLIMVDFVRFAFLVYIKKYLMYTNSSVG